MDVSKLEAGMRVKNYKVLCELLGEKVKGGNAKQNHLSDFKRYVKYKKEGNAFLITEILPTPEARVDRRTLANKLGNNRKDFEQFKIPIEYENRSGVYKITQGNKIYIGSTFREKGFRARFRQHRYKTNETITRLMLLNGGTFEILWMCEENLLDEYVVRKIEEFLIKLYKENPDYNVVNSKGKTWMLSNKRNLSDIATSKGWLIVRKLKNKAICRCVTCGYEKTYSITTLKIQKTCPCDKCKNRDMVKYSKTIKVTKEDYKKIVDFMKANNIDFK